MEKKTTLNKVLEGHSPVNKYDLMAVEWSGSRLTEERMILAFQAFDELIPQLGIYSRIFSKLRNDFFEAIYSDDLTGESFRENGELKEFIQRLPYFCLFQKRETKQDEVLKEVKEQLETVKERLFNKHTQLEENQKKLEELQEDVENLKQQVETLDQTITEKNLQLESLQNEKDREEVKAKDKQHQLECDVTELQISLDDAKSEINFLTTFKKGYDKLQNAFLDKDHRNNLFIKQMSVESTRYSNLVSDIEAGQKLENQMLSVMNIAIEEFEKFLEEHKCDLEKKTIEHDMTDAELELQDMEIDDADQELQLVEERFNNTVNEMGTELELLKQHRAMLLEQLQKLEDSKTPQLNEKSKASTPSNRPVDSRLAAGLMDDETEEVMDDPFIPQERVFSKYAAMLYTSNNMGKSFEEFKDAKYCQSCGEKTIICPHKLSGSEKIYILPINCSHLKITRPKVRINKEFAKKFGKPASAVKVGSAIKENDDDDDDEDDEDDDSILSDDTDLLSETDGPLSHLSGHSLSLGGAELYMTHTAQHLFDDFTARTDLERIIPRKLTLERTVSVIEQFLAYLLWQDEYGDDDQYFSILDTLYQFMEERYLVSDIKYMATYDFLSSVVEYSTISKMLQLVGHVLCGNLDASCLRYILLLNDFIHTIDWLHVDDFRAFISIIYPFLGEDEFENLQMSYTSFSENHISPKLVTDFMIHLILKYREPRFLENENQLVPYQTQSTSQLSEKEFKEAVDNIIPVCNEKLRKRLYFEAEKAVAMDGVENSVSIMRLAHILFTLNYT
ncbi:hypothetical protein SNE40_007324 [Patella caerulea]|uniref:Uncharacterized protein n=1 Tax=Patella caerulea TaxID=87958 RepID=A0AAN8Q269_PATCE